LDKYRGEYQYLFLVSVPLEIVLLLHACEAFFFGMHACACMCSMCSTSSTRSTIQEA
jgi:hypothetical protein